MFQLMVPSGYPGVLRLEGAIGGRPDTLLIGVFSSGKVSGTCYRSTLPPFLDSLVFNFVSPFIQNFYYLHEFFVVSDTLKNFLEVHAGCSFEAKAIRTKHPHGEETEQFWAMKVATQVDCILPSKSFADRRLFWDDKTVQPFCDLAIEVKLSADIAPYFANRGSDTYYAYPDYGVRSVSIDFGSVPQGVRLFQPLYWPSFLLVDSSFSDEFEKQCSGASPGYYFWTLGFDDVTKEYYEMMHMLR